MKIVIPAWHVLNTNVGLGRYTKNLIDALGRIDRKHNYEILMPVESDSFVSRENFHYRCCRFPFFKRRVWEQLATQLVGPYDILHLPYDSCIARKRGKLVVTIHDVKPVLFPKPHSRVRVSELFKKLFMPRPFETIDHVITVSNSSRKDIIQHLEVSSGRVTAIPQGVEHDKFFPASEYHLPQDQHAPYILSVAGADPTKNIVSLIEAYSLLPSEVRVRYQLRLVGDLKPQGRLLELVKKNGLESQVVFMGVISDAQLVHCYQQASVFVFPSLYEGFGLPVLEAMACGCPVIASNTSSLPEVVGHAGKLVNPKSPTEMMKVMAEVLIDTDLAESLRKMGRVQAEKFSWENTARATVDLYEKIGHA